MYRPEWLTWWYGFSERIRHHTMDVYFPEWKANPMNKHIKQLYKELYLNQQN